MDTNHDGICDLSQSPPDDTVNTSTTNTDNLTESGKKRETTKIHLLVRLMNLKRYLVRIFIWCL